MNLGDIVSLIFGELHQMKSLNKTELLFNVEATFVKKEQHVFEILAGSDTFFESASTKNGREVRFLYLTCMITLILSQNRLGLLLFSAEIFLLHFVFASRMEFVQ